MHELCTIYEIQAFNDICDIRIDDKRLFKSDSHSSQTPGLINSHQLLGIDANKVAPLTAVYVNLWEDQDSFFHINRHDFTGTEW